MKNFYCIIKSVAVYLFLFAIICVSFDIRVQTWKKEKHKWHDNFIYTLESALLLRYARLAVDNRIPDTDKKIEFPDGIKSFETYSLAGNIFFARIYKLFKMAGYRDLDLDTFHRYFIPAYFVLLSVVSVFLIGRMFGNTFLALVMAFWFGVYIPSVIRSTGQEFMGENFALPLIFFHAAMYLAGLKTGRTVFFVISSVFLALGWVFWDMTNLYIYVFAVFLSFTEKRTVNILIFSVSLCCVAVIDPYLRAHYSWMSIPILYLVAISGVNMILPKTKPDFQKYEYLIKPAMFIIIVLFSAKTAYGTDYGHFAELFLAKIKYLNIKPIDPSRLTFDVRVLWAPALHSATLYQACKYFSCILIIGMISIFLRFSGKSKLFCWEKYLLVCFLIFFGLYLLFIRVHVYAAFYAVLMLLFCNTVKNKRVQVCVNILLALLCLGEYCKTISYQQYMGRGEDYRSLSSLIQWIQKNTDPDDPILAPINLAGPILNYTDRTIIIQPKYEKESARSRYKNFLIALFSEKESPFYNFAVKHGAKYFIYQKGTSWNNSIYSPVYFVGLSQDKARNSLAAKFEGDINSLDKFYLVYENFQYKIFKLTLARDIEIAKRFLEEGEEYFAQSDYSEAETCYRKSLEVYPNFRQARMRLGTVLWYRGEKDEAHFQWDRGAMVDSGSL